MLYEQRSLHEKFNIFLSKFGLKRYWVAALCKIPKPVLYGFASGSRAISREQANRLDSFISEYEQINAKLICDKN